MMMHTSSIVLFVIDILPWECYVYPVSKRIFQSGWWIARSFTLHSQSNLSSYKSNVPNMSKRQWFNYTTQTELITQVSWGFVFYWWVHNDVLHIIGNAKNQTMTALAEHSILSFKGRIFDLECATPVEPFVVLWVSKTIARVRWLVLLFAITPLVSSIFEPL